MALQNQHDIKLMCEVLGVSRSSYCKFLNRKESNRDIENKQFQEKILKIYNESKKRYGAPKIHKTIIAKGFTISLKRVQRIMKKLDIKSIVIRKFRPYFSKKKVEEKENYFK